MNRKMKNFLILKDFVTPLNDTLDEIKKKGNGEYPSRVKGCFIIINNNFNSKKEYCWTMKNDQITVWSNLYNCFIRFNSKIYDLNKPGFIGIKYYGVTIYLKIQKKN